MSRQPYFQSNWTVVKGDGFLAQLLPDELRNYKKKRKCPTLDLHPPTLIYLDLFLLLLKLPARPLEGSIHLGK